MFLGSEVRGFQPLARTTELIPISSKDRKEIFKNRNNALTTVTPVGSESQCKFTERFFVTVRTIYPPPRVRTFL